jgi:hypothetical protein
VNFSSFSITSAKGGTMRIRLLVASFLLGGIACGTDLSTAAVAGARSGCLDLGGNIQSGNRCRVYASTSNYLIDMRYATDYVDQQAVTGFLAQERDRVVNMAQAPGAKFLPYALFLTSDYYGSGQNLSTTRAGLGYGRPPHGTQTIALKAFYDAEGFFHGAKYKCFNYDLNQNRPVTLDTLFAPGTKPIDAIYTAVATDLARQQSPRHFKLEPGIGHDPAHYQNFAITDDSVIFFFGAGEFFPAESGDTTVPVPRSKLPPLQV